MPKKPHADTRLAQYLTTRVLELRPKKSQIEIAGEAGFQNPNVVAMIKSGATKLPLDRVPALAHALDCDPAFLLRLALEQAVGDTAAKAIIEIFGTPVSANEAGWLQEIREASDHTDPRLTGRARTTLRGIFSK